MTNERFIEGQIAGNQLNSIEKEKVLQLATRIGDIVAVTYNDQYVANVESIKKEFLALPAEQRALYGLAAAVAADALVDDADAHESGAAFIEQLRAKELQEWFSQNRYVEPLPGTIK